MAIDPAHLADELVWAALSPYFPDRIPPNLGSEVFKTNRIRLRDEGLPDVDHAQEVLARSLTNALEYLHRHSGEAIRQPRAWFYKICNNEITRYRREAFAQDSESVLSLVEGQTDLLDVNIYDLQRINTIMREAIQQLPPRHRELILLDMVHRLSADKIEKTMGIHSHSYFLKLKSESFSILKNVVRKIIEEEISSLL